MQILFQHDTWDEIAQMIMLIQIAIGNPGPNSLNPISFHENILPLELGRHQLLKQ
jgi:hypothetical protein